MPTDLKTRHLNEDEAWQALKGGAVITPEHGGRQFRMEWERNNWRRYDRKTAEDGWEPQPMTDWRLVETEAGPVKPPRELFWLWQRVVPMAIGAGLTLLIVRIW